MTIRHRRSVKHRRSQNNDLEDVLLVHLHQCPLSEPFASSVVAEGLSRVGFGKNLAIRLTPPAGGVRTDEHKTANSSRARSPGEPKGPIGVDAIPITGPANMNHGSRMDQYIDTSQSRLDFVRPAFRVGQIERVNGCENWIPLSQLGRERKNARVDKSPDIGKLRIASDQIVKKLLSKPSGNTSDC
jgi:hypothetical protein